MDKEYKVLLGVGCGVWLIGVLAYIGIAITSIYLAINVSLWWLLLLLLVV